MRTRRGWIAALLAGLAWASTAQAREVELGQPSFEKKGVWTLAQGAKNGAGTKASEVVWDDTVAHTGRQSLRMRGDAGTVIWNMAAQAFDVAGGERVLCTVWARSEKLRREKNQYTNANALMLFFDASGKRLGIVTSPLVHGDRDWVELHVHAIAPPGTVRGQVGVFSSLSGTAWFDDIRVRAAQAEPVDAESRALAWEAFERRLRATYPFWGIAGRPEADALFAKHHAEALGAQDPDAFADAVYRVLVALGDVHVSLETPTGRRFSTTGNPHRPNWNLAAIRKTLGDVVLDEGGVLVGRIGKGKTAEKVGYAQIPSFSMTGPVLGRLIDAIESLDETRGLIIDVRPNGGGDERQAMRIFGRFTGKDVVYARNSWRDPTLPGTDGFLPPVDRVLQPSGSRLFAGKRVVALQGPYCVSSTEGLLLMAKALDGVTTVGLPSRGASANPARFPLWEGYGYSLSRWRSLGLDGKCIEGVGVAPDILVEANHGSSDPTLERALAIARGKE